MRERRGRASSSSTASRHFTAAAPTAAFTMGSSSTTSSAWQPRLTPGRRSSASCALNSATAPRSRLTESSAASRSASMDASRAFDSFSASRSVAAAWWSRAWRSASSAAAQRPRSRRRLSYLPGRSRRRSALLRLPVGGQLALELINALRVAARRQLPLELGGATTRRRDVLVCFPNAGGGGADGGRRAHRGAPVVSAAASRGSSLVQTRPLMRIRARSVRPRNAPRRIKRVEPRAPRSAPPSVALLIIRLDTTRSGDAALTVPPRSGDAAPRFMRSWRWRSSRRARSL